MITRDSAASIKGNAANARERLGQVIEHYMLERKFNDQTCSRKISASARDVERMRKGELVPSPDQWRKLKKSIAYGLENFTQLYQRAREEAEAEARDRAARRAPDKINSSLGEQLAQVKITEHTPIPPRPQPAPVLAVVPDPQPESKLEREAPKVAEAMKRLPDGWKSSDAIQRRREFVRDLLRKRPGIRGNGADSINSELMRVFGVGMSDVTIKELREQVEAERKGAAQIEIRGEPEPIAPEQVAVIAKLVDASPAQEKQIARELTEAAEARPGDVEAAVALILEALPGLQTFTISVDEQGEASFAFEIRKVKIETVGGSGKVRR